MTTASPVPYHALPEGSRFDHVCIAGPSLRRLVATYADGLGGHVAWGEILPLGAVVATVVYPGGGGHVEVMAPTPGSTFLDSFLTRTGGQGGPHHLTWIVHDLRTTVERLRDGGFEVFGERYDDPAWSEAFVHPRSNDGVLLQVAEPGPDVEVTMIRDLDALFAAAGEATATSG